MKFSLAFTAATIAVSTTTDAFTANISNMKTHRAISTERRMNARIDTADLVSDAMKKTEEFGATSPEARLAWEAVEEVDSSDNSAASKGSLNDDCEVVEDPSPECVEYGEALGELQDRISSTQPASSTSSTSAVVAPVKLSSSKGVAAPQSKELKIALEEARKITDEKGLGSPEVALAWETVEEIASAGNYNAMGGALSTDDEECLAEEAAKEACEALEEVKKIVADKN